MIINKHFKYIIIWCAILAIIILLAVVISPLLEHRQEVTLQGVVECRSYRASPKVAGRIDSLFVAEGDVVQQGELLYVVATPELDAKMRQVEALYDAAMALDKEVDIGARKQQIDAALQLWNRAKAGVELASRNLERAEMLYNSGVVSRQQYDEALANFEAMRASELAAHAEYELVRDGASTEQKKAAAAKVREALGGMDEVASYRKGARVYAPVDGRVASIILYPGELVSAGLPVVTILDLSDLWVSMNVREDMMPKLSYGSMLRGYVPALDAVFDFEVYYIAPEADFATWTATKARGGFDIRSFEVRMRCKTPNVALLPGMSIIINEV